MAKTNKPKSFSVRESIEIANAYEAAREKRREEQKKTACKNCRFWSDYENDTGRNGECRRAAPTGFQIRRETASWVFLSMLSDKIIDRSEATATGYFWPETKGGEWCGEFKARPK
jgi:hypothetical protein